MTEVSITLSIPYDLSEGQWKKLDLVYHGMPGWLGYGAEGRGEEGIPYWFGVEEDDVFLWASSEPPGLLIEGQMDQAEWERWIHEFKTLASQALGFEVLDATE